MPTTALLLCIVVNIADGDTLTARCEAQADLPAQTIKVRLAAIDAPEKGQPFGRKSREHLAQVCAGQSAELRPQTTDRYGPTVARVICNNVDANAEQVRAGMAWAFTKYLTDPAIRDLERQARDARLGLWADTDPIAPWAWRAGERASDVTPIGGECTPK